MTDSLIRSVGRMTKKNSLKSDAKKTIVKQSRPFEMTKKQQSGRERACALTFYFPCVALRRGCACVCLSVRGVPVERGWWRAVAVNRRVVARERCWRRFYEEVRARERADGGERRGAEERRKCTR